MQADLRNASFFREFMPNYVCSDPANPGGPKLVLSKIEENAYAQEQDIVVRTACKVCEPLTDG